MVITHQLSVHNVTYGYDEEKQRWYELGRTVGPMPRRSSGQYFPLVTQQDLNRLWVEQVQGKEQCLSLS